MQIDAAIRMPLGLEWKEFGRGFDAVDDVDSDRSHLCRTRIGFQIGSIKQREQVARADEADKARDRAFSLTINLFKADKKFVRCHI